MNFNKFFRTALVAGAAFGAGLGVVSQANALDITGAGATFPFPIYSKWADAYKKETGIGLNYQSIGSGAGIKQIQAKTVAFGATDAPLNIDQLKKDGLVQWPQVMGALVAIVNVDGVKSGEMVLDGPTVADIYLGKIKTLGRCGDQEAEPQVEPAQGRDHRRSSVGRFGHDLRVDELPVRGQRRMEGEGWLRHCR